MFESENYGTDNATVATILRDAVGVIEKAGWCQNTLMNQAGQVCMHGAIAVAAGWKNLDGTVNGHAMYHTTEWKQYYDTSVRFEQASGFCGPIFNDQPSTTEEDVKKILLTTADKIEVM